MAGEQGVDALIALIVAAVENGEVDAVVEQRPQRAVRIAPVILGVVFGREIEGRVGDAIGLGQGRLGRPLGDRAAPAEPQPPVRLQRRLETNREAARRGCLDDRRDAVRYNDEAVHDSASDRGRLARR